mmetsp:Transcript_19413/g.40153  ORF Transcript_19413/g.40153 Transcript_19413/m.40153 type:complete len:315 (-) Transcript_19413:306-1250(-)
MANHCLLSRATFPGGNGETVYTLSSHDMAEETWGFTDRPFQVESTQTTTAFFDTFDAKFGVNSEGGSPNAAFTFVHEQDHVFNGPLVAVMIDASYMTTDESTGEVTYTYELAQSEEQASVLGLDSFFEDGGDGVLFEDCSLFIDSSSSWCDAPYDKWTETQSVNWYLAPEYNYLTCQCQCGNCLSSNGKEDFARFHCWWATEPVKIAEGKEYAGSLAVSTTDDEKFAGNFYCLKKAGWLPGVYGDEYYSCNESGYVTINRAELYGSDMYDFGGCVNRDSQYLFIDRLREAGTTAEPTQCFGPRGVVQHKIEPPC